MTKFHELMLFFGLLLIFCFSSARSIEAAPAPPLEDAQSTSGPTPPLGVARASTTPASPNAVVIPNVPAYDWRHGCGPTAGGMVLGYWDSQGFDELIPGDASTQTSAVNQAIASDGEASNFSDYCLPLDYAGIHSNPLPDKSELPEGDEHPDDCLADDMSTSQSARNNYYGWSWSSDVSSGLQQYVERLGAPYIVTIRNLYHWDNLMWDAYRAEINAGRPMVLLVDTDGDGNTDHFVTAVGYDVVNGVRRYGSYDTWGDAVRWETFDTIAPGVSWGVWGATLFDISLDIAPPATPTLDPIINPTGSSTYTITWPAVATATSYQLQVAADPAFLSSTAIYTVTASPFLVVDQPVGPWFYRVRAHHYALSSGWSNVVSTTVDAAPLTAPVLDPISEGTPGGAIYTCTLTWSAVPSATHYQLEESDAVYFVTPTLRYEGVALSHTLHIDIEEIETASVPTVTYYFRVRALRAISPTGQSPWSNIQSITIELPTPPPLYLPLVLRQAGMRKWTNQSARV